MSKRKARIRDHMLGRHAESWPILQSIQESDLAAPVYEGEDRAWTVFDIVVHLADAEKGLLGQVRRLAAGEEVLPADFDLDRWNRGAVRRGAGRSLEELLDAIEAHFQEALDFLGEIDEGKLDLTGRSSFGDMRTAEEFFLRMANHRWEHTSDLRSQLKPS